MKLKFKYKPLVFKQLNENQFDTYKNTPSYQILQVEYPKTNAISYAVYILPFNDGIKRIIGKNFTTYRDAQDFANKHCQNYIKIFLEQFGEIKKSKKEILKFLQKNLILFKKSTDIKPEMKIYIFDEKSLEVKTISKNYKPIFNGFPPIYFSDGTYCYHYEIIPVKQNINVKKYEKEIAKFLYEETLYKD